MPASHPDPALPDPRWDADSRNETSLERLDRNWTDLLQELRVTQTGVQLLTGFLLTLPFQQRFTTLPGAPRTVYLITVGVAFLSTVMLVAPVSLHRILFRQHRRPTEVTIGHRFALAGMVLLGIAMSGAVDVIFSMVNGVTSGWAAAGVTLVAFGAAWICLPLALSRTPGTAAAETSRHSADS